MLLLFGSLLLINVLTAIIFDIYRDKNQQSEGSWETDLVDMQINDTLHLLYRRGVRLRNEEHDQKSSWYSSALESVQAGAALNKSEVADIIEWNRAMVYFKVFKGYPSLFPDLVMQGHKALKDFMEEERSTDRMLEFITEKVTNNNDRTELMEKQLKDMQKLVMEIHERLFPKAKLELASRLDSLKEYVCIFFFKFNSTFIFPQRRPRTDIADPRGKRREECLRRSRRRRRRFGCLG